MSKHKPEPAPTPTRGRHTAPPSTLPSPQTPPTEPAEVLGRHKNSGQKDHKGAR
jgi:hypothetical protein